jgi:hypothetical protein
MSGLSEVDIKRMRDQLFLEGPERGRRLSRYWRESAWSQQATSPYRGKAAGAPARQTAVGPAPRCCWACSRYGAIRQG